jgi:chorismate-pyruvate lyase
MNLVRHSSAPAAPSTGSTGPLRRRFLDPGIAAREREWGRRLLPLLLAQTGSTTRLCERVAGGPVSLILVRQQWLAHAPLAIAPVVGAGRCLERVTTIHAHGEVMMDNLVYIGSRGLGEEMMQGLGAGSIPIGHLVEHSFARRVPLAGGEAILEQLWALFGERDPGAGRAYCLEVAGGPLMCIAEAYRHGMLREPPGLAA